MKKIYCLLAAAILAVGCTEDITTDNTIVNNDANYEYVDVVADLEINEDSRTTLTNNGQGGKVVWSENDAIGAVLEDGTIVERVVKSIDGGKATFSVPTTTLYAIYPYSSKTTYSNGVLSHTLVNTVALDGSAKVFGDGQNVMVAHLSEGKLPFKHLCGFIEVKLKGTGTVKHVALRSNAKNWDVMSGLGTINVSDATNPTFVPDSNHGVAYNWVYATCNNVELSKSEATSFYFIVPPRTYKDLCICVQTEEGSYTISSKNSIVVNRAMIRPIAAIDIDTVKPTAATDLSAGGVANCYIVPQGGDAKYYSFPARKISSAANLEGAAYAHLVWSESSTLVTNVSYDAATGMVSFKYEGNQKEGNALVSVLNSKHEILWSWHIWCTDQPQMVRIKAKSVDTYYGQLDRNLGATYAPKSVAEATGISAEDATKSAGLYYQYGRPTPFPRVKNIADKNAEETAFISNTNVAVEYGFRNYSQDFRRSTTTGFSMSAAVVYPNMFYAISYTDKTGAELGGNQSCNTWHSGAINPNTQKDQLWYSLNKDVVDKKADNDPCPAGYVPEEGWGVYNNRYTFTGVGSYGLYYTCPVTNNLMWFPLSGYRNHASGKASSIGSNFNIWAVPTMGTNNGAVSAVRWNANAASADAPNPGQLCYLDYNQLSQGFGVRCRVMDRSALQN